MQFGVVTRKVSVSVGSGGPATPPHHSHTWSLPSRLWSGEQGGNPALAAWRLWPPRVWCLWLAPSSIAHASRGREHPGSGLGLGTCCLSLSGSDPQAHVCLPNGGPASDGRQETHQAPPGTAHTFSMSFSFQCEILSPAWWLQWTSGPEPAPQGLCAPGSAARPPARSPPGLGSQPDHSRGASLGRLE